MNPVIILAYRHLIYISSSISVYTFSTAIITYPAEKLANLNSPQSPAAGVYAVDEGRNHQTLPETATAAFLPHRLLESKIVFRLDSVSAPFFHRIVHHHLVSMLVLRSQCSKRRRTKSTVIH